MAAEDNLSPRQFTLIQGGKSNAECRCDEPDVYDGYADCPVHGRA